MKLVDLRASKARAYGRVGSSPTLRTKLCGCYGESSKTFNERTVVRF